MLVCKFVSCVCNCLLIAVFNYISTGRPETMVWVSMKVWEVSVKGLVSPRENRLRGPSVSILYVIMYRCANCSWSRASTTCEIEPSFDLSYVPNKIITLFVSGNLLYFQLNVVDIECIWTLQKHMKSKLYDQPKVKISSTVYLQIWGIYKWSFIILL